MINLSAKLTIGLFAAVCLARPAASSAGRTADDHLKDAVCADRVIAKLDDWAPERAWIPRFDPAPGVKAYKTATSKIGTWVESEVYPDRHVELNKYHLTYDGKKGLLWQELVTWEKGSCEEKSAVNFPFGEVPPKRPFTDRDLREFVEKNPDGAIVYTWSPAMPLSEESVRFIEEAVDELNVKGHKLAVTFVADPDLPLELIDHGATTIKTLFHGKIGEPRQMYSFELRELGVAVHYPSIVLYRQGRLRSFIPGAMGKSRYIELIKGALQI